MVKVTDLNLCDQGAKIINYSYVGIADFDLNFELFRYSTGILKSGSSAIIPVEVSASGIFENIVQGSGRAKGVLSGIFGGTGCGYINVSGLISNGDSSGIVYVRALVNYTGGGIINYDIPISGGLKQKKLEFQEITIESPYTIQSDTAYCIKNNDFYHYVDIPIGAQSIIIDNRTYSIPNQTGSGLFPVKPIVGPDYICSNIKGFVGSVCAIDNIYPNDPKVLLQSVEGNSFTGKASIIAPLSMKIITAQKPDDDMRVIVGGNTIFDRKRNFQDYSKWEYFTSNSDLLKPGNLVELDTFDGWRVNYISRTWTAEIVYSEFTVVVTGGKNATGQAPTGGINDILYPPIPSGSPFPATPGTYYDTSQGPRMEFYVNNGKFFIPSYNELVFDNKLKFGNYKISYKL
ncbi:MAG: hypothetical protein HC836_27750 [Richelia sp. RM2_1_2]|nr:hypothetical protein [Richelia sp. RM2_1_2]